MNTSNHNEYLIQALDECLELIEKGASLEQALQRYPLLAAELRPMLEAAEATADFAGSITAASGAQAHSRAEFLGAAQAHKQHKPLWAITRPRPQKANPRPFLFNFAQAALILFVVFAVGSVTAAGVSAEALPGDALYPVKLATERTQLLLTTNPQDRLELEQSFDEERVEEIQTLITRSRTSSVNFAGTLESTGENEWQVGGVKLVVGEQTEIEDNLETGYYLVVTGELLSDGSVQVTRVSAREAEVKGKIESLSPVEWRVSGIVVLLTSNTVIEGTPETGRTAEVKGYLMSDNSLQAREIKVKNQKGAPESPAITEEENEETRPTENEKNPSVTPTATRTPRPERTRTETEEPDKTPEPSRTPVPEETNKPDGTRTEEPDDTPKPTGDN